MNNEQLSALLRELIEKLSEGSDGHRGLLEQLARQFIKIKPALMDTEEFTQLIEDIDETLRSIRLAVSYMAFDLEATRREKNTLLAILEDQDND